MDISTVHETFGKMLAYRPLAPTACTPGMADAAACDLIARGHTSCKSSRSPIEYSTCMKNFIDATPRNCAISNAADKAACDAHNKANFPGVDDSKSAITALTTTPPPSNAFKIMPLPARR